MGEGGGDGDSILCKEPALGDDVPRSLPAGVGLVEMLKPPTSVEAKALVGGSSSQSAISPPEAPALFLAQPQTASQEGECRYVSFSLSGLRLAASIENVAYVGSMPALTPLPNVPTWVKGVVNLRGEILPVLSLAPFLGLEEPVNPPSGMVVVKASGGEAAAVLMADEVGKIVRTRAAFAKDTAGFICGSFIDEDGECRIVDVEKLLASPELARYG
jgi:chemotaxis signal transduction protein